MVLTFVSLLAFASPAPKAHVELSGRVCTVRPLVQGSGTVRECTFSSVARGSR